MGGTDFIDNPGPYLHRNSRKVPHMGVLSAPATVKPASTGLPLPPLPEGADALSREATVQAYANRLDALKLYEEAAAAEAEAASAQAEAAARASGPIPPIPGRSLPFEPVREPLYPQVPAADGDTAAVRTPRWRGG